MKTKKSWPTSSICSVASWIDMGLSANCLVLTMRPLSPACAASAAISSCECRLRGDGRELGRRLGRRDDLLVSVAGLAVDLVVVLLDATHELVAHQVDGGIHVGGGLARPDHGTAGEHRRLGDARFGDARVLLNLELELHPRDLVDLALLQELVDMLDLLVGVVLQGGRHGDIAALDLGFHRHRSFGTAWSRDAWAGVARTVRAKVKTWGSRSAWASASAHWFNVSPVV